VGVLLGHSVHAPCGPQELENRLDPFPGWHSHYLSDTNSGWWATPSSIWNLHSKWPTPSKKCRLRHISAYNISTIRDGEKSSIMANRKL